jgi:hypothetical protein
MVLPFTLSLDRTGFPILEMPALPFGVLWLPVTKIQFEHFLVDTGCVGYLVYPFLGKRQFFERMCQVANTSLSS